ISSSISSIFFPASNIFFIHLPCKVYGDIRGLSHNDISSSTIVSNAEFTGITYSLSVFAPLKLSSNKSSYLTIILPEALCHITFFRFIKHIQSIDQNNKIIIIAITSAILLFKLVIPISSHVINKKKIDNIVANPPIHFIQHFPTYSTF